MADQSDEAFRLSHWTLGVIGLTAFTLVVVCECGGRPLTPNDLFRADEIGSDCALSPDKRAVAFTVNQARLSDRDQIRNNGRLRVWVSQLIDGRKPELVSAELAGDQLLFASSCWSPDGRRLAIILSNPDGEHFLEIWDRETHAVTHPTKQLVASYPVRRSFAWTDDTHVAAVMLADGVRPIPNRDRIRDKGTEWLRQQREGRIPTVNILDGGLVEHDSNSEGASAELVLINVLTGETRLLDRAQSFQDLQVSPDGRHVAIMKAVRFRKTPSRAYATQGSLLSNSEVEYEVTMIDSKGALSKSYSGLLALPESLQWSRDGREFAFLGCGSEQESAVQAFRCDLEGQIKSVALPAGVAGWQIAWGPGAKLFVQGIDRRDARKERYDWWLTDGNSTTNLTEQFKVSPRGIAAAADGKVLVGVIEGVLWRFDSDHNKWGEVSAGNLLPVDRVIFAEQNVLRDGTLGRAIIATHREALIDYYCVDLQSGSSQRISRPSQDAKVVAFDFETNTGVFLTKESTRCSLDLVRDGKVFPILDTNQFMREVSIGDCKSIRYRSLDGEDLFGWLVLPINYRADTKYPLVTWVYPGITYQETKPPNGALLNGEVQLFAARGYAVLLPSMPLPPTPAAANGVPSDPYLELPKGVLPAVDKAVDLGFADSARVAIVGHSFGGYAAYGLTTLTNRFRAAIAVAGPSDFISDYGTFDAIGRLQPGVMDKITWPPWFEDGTGGMGNPPWKDWSRYLRNSPIFYVERIQTPVLIIQGSDDWVPIAQGEEMFTALHRQGKRVRLAQYWGEGHIFGSPANVRDEWMQVYAWLDEFCDIERDSDANMIFDGSRPKSRNGAPVLKPEDFAKFDEITRLGHAADSR